MTHILLVDDNADSLYLLRVLLQGHGYSTEEAANGKQALARALANPPDLVISDLMMPVMDGYTLLRAWSREPALRAVPFIVYTATFIGRRDEMLAFELGASSFLVKPTEPAVLLRHVEQALAAGRCSDRPNEAPEPQREVERFQLHNTVLIDKLEQRNQELEAINRELLAEMAERRAVEEVLRLRDRVIQELRQGITIADATLPDNPLIFASLGLERMTGYRVEEMIGRNCRMLQGSGTDPQSVALLREAIAGGRSCTVELLNYRKDGTAFWNAVSLSPVHDADGRLTHIVGVQNDVTDRRRLEAQFRQSQKMEAVGRLAGGIAHDFNNLLTIIGISSEQLLDMPQLAPEIREAVSAIRKAGDRAGALTHQLLGFSRQTIVQPRIVDLNASVNDATRLLGRLIGANITVSLALDPALNPIRIDPVQLDQILLNLVVNARDAMPAGGKLSIETRNVLLTETQGFSPMECRPGPYVMLSLTDNGIGMTREVASQIFEPFFTTKAPGSGTGLGLAMVFGIVQQNGGCLHVLSEPGLGTTFNIHFPVADGAVARGQETVLGEVRRGTETVLLVEDDAAVRQVALTSLEMYGYTVITAADGEEGLATLAAADVELDIVLTDVVMPTISGPVLAERLNTRFPDLKVIFTSGYTDDMVMRHALLGSNVSFIQKPYTALGLVRKLREVLDGPATPGRPSFRP